MKQKIQTKQIRVVVGLLEEVREKLSAIHDPVKVSERDTVDLALKSLNKELGGKKKKAKKGFSFWRK